jgi:hypothetical protein
MGEFARRVKAAGWEDKLESQRAELRQHMPTTEEETVAKALSNLDSLRAIAQRLGYLMRSSQHARGVQPLLEDPTPGIPGREVLIRMPMPAAKELPEKMAGFLDWTLGPLLRPARQAVEDAKLEAQRMGSEELSDLTRVTSEPSTLPWYYPTAVLTAPQAFMAGHRQADKELDTRTNAKMDAQIMEARKQFEEALRAEYSEGRQMKVATAGELLDGLARIHTKSADGELGQAAGLYLAVASLLGGVSHMAVKDWWEKRDPQQQRLSAMREAIKKRIRGSPPPVLVAPEEPKLEEVPELSPA